MSTNVSNNTADSTNKKASWLTHVMRFIIPLVVTVGLCWVMFRSIDFKEMMQVIHKHCDFRWIGLTLSFSLLSHVIRALRWRIQLNALGIYASRWELVLSIFGTYAVNLVFPRLGEVWRSGYIANRQHASFATVFGSMVAERLADFFTVLTLLVLTLLVASHTILSYLLQNEETYHKIMHLLESPWLWLVLLACVVVAWRMLTYKAKSGSLLARLQGFVKGLWHGFASIGTMPHKGRWLFYTLCLWGCYFTQLYVAFYAFPFTTAVLHQYGIVVALVAFVLSSIAMGVPSNGGIGPWQWAIMFALSMYGIDKTDSGAFANLVLGSQTVLLIVLGIFTFVMIMLMKHRSQPDTEIKETNINKIEK